MMKGLEYVFYGEELTEPSVWRRLSGRSYQCVLIHKESSKETEPGGFVWFPVAGQESMTLTGTLEVLSDCQKTLLYHVDVRALAQVVHRNSGISLPGDT